jgi:hypothetical protein
MSTEDPNAPPAGDYKIPNSLRLLMMLTDNLRTSTTYMVDWCQTDQSAMDQVALNEELLGMAEPAIYAAVTKIEAEAEAEQKRTQHA